MNIENTGIFKSSSPVGIQVTMPSDVLDTISQSGPGALTVVSGLNSSALNIQTIGYSGDITVGLDNSNSFAVISQQSTGALSIIGALGSAQVTAQQGAGPVSLNQVLQNANIAQTSTTNIYIGGPEGLVISGSSSDPSLVQYSDGTCSVSGGQCSKISPKPVQQVTAPVFQKASVGQICSCNGGCVTPSPPPSPLGSQCSSTGPSNCRSCCEKKLLTGTITSDGSCFTYECSPFVAPPNPTPGAECASTGPACRDCCFSKATKGTMRNDASCFTPQCSPFLPPPPAPKPSPPPSPPPLGSQCSSTADCRSCCQRKFIQGTWRNDPSCLTQQCSPFGQSPSTPVLGASCASQQNCRKCCENKLTTGQMFNDQSCLTPQCRPNIVG